MRKQSPRMRLCIRLLRRERERASLSSPSPTRKVTRDCGPDATRRNTPSAPRANKTPDRGRDGEYPMYFGAPDLVSKEAYINRVLARYYARLAYFRIPQHRSPDGHRLRDAPLQHHLRAHSRSNYACTGLSIRQLSKCYRLSPARIRRLFFEWLRNPSPNSPTRFRNLLRQHAPSPQPSPLTAGLPPPPRHAQATPATAGISPPPPRHSCPPLVIPAKAGTYQSLSSL